MLRRLTSADGSLDPSLGGTWACGSGNIQGAQPTNGQWYDLKPASGEAPM